MKRTILTAMLFFCFLVLGMQSATAQYVNSDDASNLLMSEMQVVVDNPIYANQLEKNAQYADLKLKLNFYNGLYESIKEGATVEEAIANQAVITYSTSNSLYSAQPSAKNATLSPLHQEVIDLLSQ